MIIDNIENASLYFTLGERVARALGFLAKSGISQMEQGRHEIDGSDIFALVSAYETKPKEEGAWEAHRQYIDIHAVLEGSEQMSRAYIDALDIAQPYDLAKDLIVLKGGGDMFLLKPGMFAICYPADAHMPGLSIDGPRYVKKMVVKVKVA